MPGSCQRSNVETSTEGGKGGLLSGAQQPKVRALALPPARYGLAEATLGISSPAPLQVSSHGKMVVAASSDKDQSPPAFPSISHKRQFPQNEGMLGGFVGKEAQLTEPLEVENTHLYQEACSWVLTLEVASRL